MSDTYCGLLNVLILGILAGMNGLQIREMHRARDRRRWHDSGSSEE